MEKQLDLNNRNEARDFINHLIGKTPVRSVEEALQVRDAVDIALNTLSSEPTVETIQQVLLQEPNGNLVSKNSLCAAINDSLSYAQEVSIYYNQSGNWLQWVGPRPQRPPGY